MPPASDHAPAEDTGMLAAVPPELVRRIEEQYRLFADHVQDLISLHDHEGRFIYASPSASAVIGFDPSDLVGRSVYDLVVPEDIPLLRAAHEAIARRDGGAPAVYRVRRPDGAAIWCETTARVANDPSTGEPWRIVAVTRNITARHEFEQHTRQAQKMEALGRLAGGIAHDFNNVLTVISGHAELLTSMLDDGSPERDHAEYIREAARRAATLTRQLLSFGRGKGRDLQTTDLNGAVLDVQPMIARLMGPDIDIRHDLEPALHAVRCDPAALEQILVNLAVNAREAMPDGGFLAFRTANVDIAEDEFIQLPAGRYAELVVADSGTGMKPDVAARAFEPFFTTREHDGTGLGLSTVYSIMRQIGGDVSVETSPGSGATFRLLFPGHEAESRREGHTARLASEDLKGTETVLVAEDDPGVRALVVAALQRYGYRVMAAVDGRQALDLFRTYGHLIDIIVTDVNMPELKGPELVDALSADGATLPVLYISGFTSQALARHESAPRHSFLAKPFAPAELARAIRDLLD